jgi:uncharacterized protein (TIGR01777 family)
MKVIVSGSSGFIGSALVRELAARGDDVVRLVRTPHPGPGSVAWDPAAGTIDGRSLEGADAVVHLAGVGIGSRRWTEEHKARALDSRVRGTRLLATTLAGLDAPPPTLLSASGMNFYGDRDDEELTEESAPGMGFLARLCRAWEAQTEPALEAGIRVITFRSGLVLGSGGGIFPKILLPFRLGLGGRLGTGRQWWSWITLFDEIAALIHLLGAADVQGPVNLATPNPVTNAEFTRALARALRRPAAFAVPAVALKVVLGTEMAEELMLVSLRLVPAVLEGSGFRFAHPHLEGALAVLLGSATAPPSDPNHPSSPGPP